MPKYGSTKQARRQAKKPVHPGGNPGTLGGVMMLAARKPKTKAAKPRKGSY